MTLRGGVAACGTAAVLCLTNSPPASALSLPQHVTPDPAKALACRFTSGGLTTVTGVLRIPHMSTRLASIVRFLPRAAAERYADVIEAEFAGHRPTPSAEEEADPAYLHDMLQYQQSVPQMLMKAKMAIIGSNGTFRCDGLAPGRYILLALLTSNEPANPSPVLAQTYMRADLDVPEPNARRAYLVNGFRLIGRARVP